MESSLEEEASMRRAWFDIISPFDFEQLEEFPLRLSIVKQGFNGNSGINHFEFDFISRMYLGLFYSIPSKDSAYGIFTDRTNFDALARSFFAFNCLTHKAKSPDDSLSLDEITEEDFDSSEEIGVKALLLSLKGNVNYFELRHSKEYPHILYATCAGTSRFKEGMARRFKMLGLPLGFEFGNGYEPYL